MNLVKRSAKSGNGSLNKKCMISITIGRDPNSRIILEDPAQLVSNHHAELKIKDDGSMFIYDKSANGTFVNGIKIPRNQDFPVIRGNTVLFANKLNLNWALVPEVPVAEDTLRIMTIGKEPGNDIVLSGNDRISRFHALLRITRDFGFYVYDMSTNGTFVNNLRIPARTYYKIKHGDDVLFGGMDKLNWKLISNGKPSGSVLNKFLKKLMPQGTKIKDFKTRPIMAVTVCLLVIVAGIYVFASSTNRDLYDRYGNSVCLIVNDYLYTLDFGQLGKFDVTLDRNGNPVLYTPGKNDPMSCTGTGFFISKDGKLLTNRHVTNPWSVTKQQDPQGYNALLQLANAVANAVIRELQAQNKKAGSYDQIANNNAAIASWANAQVAIGGRSAEVAILLNNTHFNSSKDLINCQVLKVAEDDRVDIGLMQTNTKMLPSQVKNLIDVNDIVSDQELKPGKKIFILGFPMGLTLAKTSEGIKANFQNGQVSRETDGFAFGHNVPETGGASGSPVFDEDGRLAGVHYSGMGNTQGFKFAITAAQVKKLLDSYGPGR